MAEKMTAQQARELLEQEEQAGKENFLQQYKALCEKTGYEIVSRPYYTDDGRTLAQGFIEKVAR